MAGSNFSQSYLFQPGLTDAEQQAAWARIVDETHARGARVFAQLMHAGALSQGDRFQDQTRAPSPVKPKGKQLQVYRGQGEYATPLELGQIEINETGPPGELSRPGLMAWRSMAQMAI